VFAAKFICPEEENWVFSPGRQSGSTRMVGAGQKNAKAVKNKGCVVRFG
jgi:hypothetical protein